jgi:hypothetical protein
MPPVVGFFYRGDGKGNSLSVRRHGRGADRGESVPVSGGEGTLLLRRSGEREEYRGCGYRN